MRLWIKYDADSGNYQAFNTGDKLGSEPLGIGRSPDEAIGMAVRTAWLQEGDNVVVYDITHACSDAVPRTAAREESADFTDADKSRYLHEIEKHLKTLRRVTNMYMWLADMAEESTTSFPRTVAAMGAVVCESMTNQGQLLQSILVQQPVRPAQVKLPDSVVPPIRRICARCGGGYTDNDMTMALYPLCPTCAAGGKI